MGARTLRGRFALLGVGSSMALVVAGVSPALASAVATHSVAPRAAAERDVPATKLTDPIPAPIRTGHVHVGLRTVATGLVSPVAGTVAPGVAGRLFVADQIGKIWSIDLGRCLLYTSDAADDLLCVD